MSNIFTYLDWRGDLTFEQSGFCEVDGLILSLLSYVEFDGAVPPPGGGEVPLGQACAALGCDDMDEPRDLTAQSTDTLRWLLRRMAHSRRYGDMKLGHYVNILDSGLSEQFSATCIRIDDRRIYMSCRGTTSDIVGWKEDFLLACMPEIPSHDEALRCLRGAAKAWPDCEIMLGGHSKGGNLAVYAAASADETLQHRISAVWCNDGPGFQRAFVQTDGYRRIQPVMRAIVPKSSVVGMLLAHEEPYTIVDSSQTGILQHDGMSWQVEGPRFVAVPNLTAESVRAEQRLREWIDSLGDGERRQFVDTLFDVLTASGATTLDQLRGDGVRATLAAITKLIGTPKDTRDRIAQFVTLLGSTAYRLTQQDALALAEKALDRFTGKK